MRQSIIFYSEGHKLAGDLFLPDGLKPGEKRAGVVLCHGYTGVKDLYLPDNARVLNEAGYIVPNSPADEFAKLIEQWKAAQR